MVRARPRRASSCPWARTARSSSRSPTGARTSSRSTTSGSRWICGRAWPTTLRSRGLADAHIGLIGRESLLHIAVDRIRDELPGLTLSWADDLIEDLRRYKSDSEIVLVREATRVGCEMVEAFVEAAVPGATEADCVVAALARGIPQGAFPLDIPVVSGPNVDHFQWERMPSWDARRPLEPGDMIHPDMYGTVNGYFYDMVRTTVAGPDRDATRSARCWRRRSRWSSTSSTACGRASRAASCSTAAPRG